MFTLVVGPPGSGKSVWSRAWVQQDPSSRVAVDRPADDRLIREWRASGLDVAIEVQSLEDALAVLPEDAVYNVISL